MSRSFVGGCWLFLIGCSDLTTVEAPNVLQPEQLANAEGAAAQYAGAVTLFAGAYGAGVPATGTPERNVVGATGLVTDEFTILPGAFTPTQLPLDIRTMSEVTGSGGGTLHSWLSRTRVNALAAIYALEQYAPEPRGRIGQLHALVAYTELFLAENFCAGLTLATVTAGRLDGAAAYGSPLSREQMLEQALADFASAEAQAGDDAQIVNLARVGQGRTLLNLGRFAEAAAAAAALPTGFVYSTEHSATVNPNVLAHVGILSVGDREGTNGLDFRSANDLRVTVAQATGPFGNVFVWTKMASLATPLTLASGTEARLIEAEAALQAGDVATWLGIHNALRVTVPGLGPLTDPGTAESRVDLHFRERAFWLFGQGQRLSDLRRLVRQYGRTVDAVFPAGPYLGPGGGAYGPEVTLVPSADQRINPNYTGCQNRAP